MSGGEKALKKLEDGDKSVLIPLLGRGFKDVI